MQLQSLKRSQHGSIEQYEKEVRRLREEIQKKEIAAEDGERAAKHDKEKLEGDISKLRSEI
jgi:hypothetical protein